MPEIIYKGNWVLVNAFFYSFWITKTDFDKYVINNTKYKNYYDPKTALLSLSISNIKI